MHPVMHFFVLIFMVTFLSTGFEGLPPIPVMFTGNCQKKKLTTGFEGLPSIPVMFTGSLQGRIGLQGVPCKPYMIWVWVWVCSVVIVVVTYKVVLLLMAGEIDNQ